MRSYDNSLKAFSNAIGCVIGHGVVCLQEMTHQMSMPWPFRKSLKSRVRRALRREIKRLDLDLSRRDMDKLVDRIALLFTQVFRRRLYVERMFGAESPFSVFLADLATCKDVDEQRLDSLKQIFLENK